MIIQYRFDRVCTEQNSRYFLQITNGRPLSNVCHTHDFYEIVFLLDGSCTKRINEKPVSLKAGEFCILEPGDSHVFLDQSDNANLLALSVERGEFERFALAYEIPREQRLNASRPNLFSAQGEYGYIAARLLPCTRGERCEQERKLLLSTLLKCCADQADAPAPLLPGDLNRMLRGMQSPENLRRGLEAMLELSHYSRTQLTRLMRQHMQTTPHQYLLHARMQTAYGMLLFSAQTPEEIGESVGYKSFSHFHKAFKAQFGTTPRELRRKGQVRTV